MEPIMSVTMILVKLVGDVGLLIWGTQMATSGFLRAYGTDLRRWLGRNLDTRSKAFAAGLIVTALLQSSTATSLMTTSFTNSGVIDLASGLCVMLGANVGTTLIVQVLSFDLAMVAPLLIIAGVIVHRRGNGNTQVEELGRILVGLGLMLLGLSMLVGTTAPVENAPLAGTVLRSLIGHPVIAILLAAAFTWACHSSVAVVLFVVSLVRSGAVAPGTALPLVLGANVGATLPPYLESGSAAARRLPLGNMLIRMIGCVAVAPFLPLLTHYLTMLEPGPARMVVNFHTLFNVALGVIFIAPVDHFANALIWLLPDPPPPVDPGEPQYLEEAALGTASVALANAAREALRMADMVQAMLEEALAVFRNDDPKLAVRIRCKDKTLDRLGVAIRRYLAELSGEALNQEDSARSQEVFAFTINLDYVGDILVNILSEFASTRLTQGQSLTPDDFEEIVQMHSQVIESLHVGLAVFMRSDEVLARQLIERKRLIWQTEAKASERYFQRLRQVHGQKGNGTDDFYLRVLRDLKRVHSLIVALAYPILDRAGQLQNRLIEIPNPDESHDGSPRRPAS
jgi:phosphate:Na+ symporter